MTILFPDPQQLHKSKRIIELYRNIFMELDHEIKPDSTILELGCGAGAVVYQFRKMGIRTFGVDIERYYDGYQTLCEEEGLNTDAGIFRTLDLSDYRLPFADSTFDFVLSDQVLEHVQDYPATLAEINRVLKPGGISLHIFPSRYIVIEPHIYVPFGGLWQNYPYLLFWALLGIRNSFQKSLDFKKVAARNYEYLRTSTNYLRKAEIKQYVNRYFDDVLFIEQLYIKYRQGILRYLYRPIYFLSRIVPFAASLVSAFDTRVMVFTRGLETSNSAGASAGEPSRATPDQQKFG